MKKLSVHKFRALLLIIFFSTVILAPVSCSAKYLVSNYRQSSEQTYKGWPIDWWATYFIQEFDKLAPAPGMDWLTGNSKHNCGPLNISEWVPRAIDKGWVVKSLPYSARVGALAITVNDSTKFARVWIVREVYDWGFKGTYIASKDGEPHETKVAYSWIVSTDEGYSFKGYIYPERMSK